MLGMGLLVCNVMSLRMCVPGAGYGSCGLEDLIGCVFNEWMI